LVIAKRRDRGVLVIIAQNGSTALRQIEWLFGYHDDPHPQFEARIELEDEKDKVGLSATFILENIGVEVEPAEDEYLGTMLDKFGGAFPKTKVFSEFARSTVDEIDPMEDADTALTVWLEREDKLFRVLE